MRNQHPMAKKVFLFSKDQEKISKKKTVTWGLHTQKIFDSLCPTSESPSKGSDLLNCEKGETVLTMETDKGIKMT